MIEQNIGILNVFYDYASQNLDRDIRRITIIESGQVAPKFDEITSDYECYVHLIEYWGKLKK